MSTATRGGTLGVSRCTFPFLTSCSFVGPLTRSCIADLGHFAALGSAALFGRRTATGFWSICTIALVPCIGPFTTICTGTCSCAFFSRRTRGFVRSTGFARYSLIFPSPTTVFTLFKFLSFTASLCIADISGRTIFSKTKTLSPAANCPLAVLAYEICKLSLAVSTRSVSA